VSRSLALAFLIALLLHVLLAGVDLDIFKGLPRARNVLEPLSVDLVAPIEEKEPSKPDKPPVIVKKPEKEVIEESITKKPKSKPRAKPAPKTKHPEIQRKQPLANKEPSRKAEAFAPPPPSKIPGDKEEKSDSETRYAFVPDMVDIPTALPKRKDIPQTGEEHLSPRTSLDEPTTVATPNYKENNPPAYPLLARRRNYEGTVLLDVLVRRDGTVGSIRLAESSGHKSLDQSAIGEVRKWTFHPGKRGGEAVEMWVKVPIRFRLK
jgi:protein TonB